MVDGLGYDITVVWYVTGPVLWPSCSDKDLSSISSISEDESSADTTDSTFSGRTLLRTASETFKDTLKDTLQEMDTVFWSDNSEPKVMATRQRSNTLPSVLPGHGLLHISQEKRRNGGCRSALAEECRRIEASMKALSASHNHRWYEVEDRVGSAVMETEENGGPFVNGASRNHVIDHSCTNGAGVTLAPQPSKDLPSHKRRHDVQITPKHLPKKTYHHDSVCQSSAYHSYSHGQSTGRCPKVGDTNMVHSYRNIQHEHLNIEPSIKQPVFCQNVGSHISLKSSRKESPKKTEKNDDVSFFNLIKAKIKKVFDIDPPPKPLESPDVIAKSLAVENWLLHSFGGEGPAGDLSTSTSLDEFEGFAVREFPQSSQPSNRSSIDVTDNREGFYVNVIDNSKGHVINGTRSERVEENGVSQSASETHRHLGRPSPKNFSVDEQNLNLKPGVLHSSVNGHITQEQKLSENKGRKSVKLKGEINSKICVSNQNQHHRVSSETNFKSQDQRRWSHDIRSCNSNGALDTLCSSVTFSGNTDNVQSSNDYSKENKTFTEPDSKVWDLHGSINDQTTETRQGNLLKSGTDLDVRIINGAMASDQPKYGAHDEAPCSHSSQNANQLCRYYHVFKEGELTALIADNVPDLRVVSTMFDHSNWCIVVEKR